MNILYFAFGLLAGLYLNSLFNTFISTIVNNVMTNNPDLIEKIIKDDVDIIDELKKYRDENANSKSKN